MTPHLTGALTQLTNLTRSELAVLAAAAQALAAAQPQRDRASEAPPPTRTGRPRQRTGEPGRHAIPEHGTIGSGPVTTDTGVGRTATAGAASDEANALRLRGRGRLLACAHQLVDPELFSSEAYRRRLGRTVPGLLYAAGCEGLLTLAERLDQPLYKVGTTEGHSTTMRMSSLAAERYASVVREGDRWRGEDGFGHWRAVGLPLTRARGRHSPVRPALRAIAYDCPISLPHGALDRAVAAALEPAGLAAFAASDEGRAACREQVIEPASLDRYSPAPLGCAQGRFERAHELVLLGPRADADRLAAVLEAVIAAHVMGQKPG